METPAATLPVAPSRLSSRRRIRRSTPRPRIRRENDARIIRSAEMLRQSLIKQHVFFSAETHDHDVPWKSLDIIQRETQRIAEDLFTSSPSLSPRRRSRSPLKRSLSPKRPDVTHVKSWPASRDPSPSSRRTRDEAPAQSPRRSLSPAQPDVAQVKSWSPSSLHLQPRSSGRRFLPPRHSSPPGRLGVPPLSPIRSRSPERGTGSNIVHTQSWSPSVSQREDPLILSPARKEEAFHRQNLTLGEALFPPLSPGSPNLSSTKRHVSPSPNKKAEDNDRYESFSEIWDSPIKKVDVSVQRTISEDLQVSVGFDYSPRQDLELKPFDEKGDASQWADLSTDIHSNDSNMTPPGAPKDSFKLDPPESSPCSIRTFPTSPEKSQVSELSVKTPSTDDIPAIPPSPSDTPVTFMGRNRKLKTKTITYLVEPYDMDDDEETYDFVETDYDDPDLLDMEGYSDCSWEDELSRRRPPTPAKALMLHMSSTSSSSLFDHLEEDEQPVIPSLFDETEDEEEDQPSSKSPFLKENTDESENLLHDFEDQDKEREERHNRVHKQSADLEKENVYSEKRQDPGNRREHRKNKQLEKAVSLALTSTSVELFEPVVDESTRKLPNISSALSSDYSILLNDPAYLHAQKAGLLWQSLVGQHVRFPSRWWNGARSPPLGAESPESSNWQYAGRFPIRGHKNLQRIVRSRGSQGRILLHIIVQDLMTRKPIQDIAIGCFHPNARGIRQTSAADRSVEDSRDVWLAIRKRCDYNVSVLDHLLLKNKENDTNNKHKKDAKSSPLGVGQRVTNQNMRVVFGDQPPMETIFCPESELFERLSKKQHLQQCPAMLLLEAYVFRTVLLK